MKILIYILILANSEIMEIPAYENSSVKEIAMYWNSSKSQDIVIILANSDIKEILTYQNSPIVCAVLALDSWNYCSGEQAQQPNIRKIPQSSLYS